MAELNTNSNIKKWKDWAAAWGLTWHKPGFMSASPEWIAGSYRGYLVKFGWMVERQAHFYALIRFPKVPDPAALRQRLLEDPALAELPGWNKIKPATSKLNAVFVPGAAPNPGVRLAVRAIGTVLQMDETMLLWTRPCPWRRPKAAQLAGWIEKLVQSLSQMARPFEGKCEECGRTLGQRFVIVNGIPKHLCETCQQGLVQKGRMAETAYDQIEANHLMGALFGAVAAVLGGATWAAISFFTGRMFALVAIGIALLVGLGYRLGAKKMDRTGQALGVLLTIAGVMFGDILFYALLVMQRRPEIGFRIDAGWFVFQQVLARSPGDVIFSLICGVIGSFYVARMLARPKFVPKIEAGDEEQRAAA
jgi:hypothetical protein